MPKTELKQKDPKDSWLFFVSFFVVVVFCSVFTAVKLFVLFCLFVI